MNKKYPTPQEIDRRLDDLLKRIEALENKDRRLGPQPHNPIIDKDKLKKL